MRLARGASEHLVMVVPFTWVDVFDRAPRNFADFMRLRSRECVVD